MKPQPLNLSGIPNVRKTRGDTDISQFILQDRATLERSAATWVRQTSQEALDEALRAGNPTGYTTEVDGKGTRGWRRGALSSANRSARVQFVGETLSELCNRLYPILVQTINKTFPNSRTKRLANRWTWWLFRDSHLGKRTAGLRVHVVPKSVTIYDVLILAPDGPLPARYAWFANRNALLSYGFKYNMSKSKTAKLGFKLRKRLRGFLAEATRRMRSRGGRGAYSGITVQGFFAQRGVTSAHAKSRYGVPVIRVAFKKSLLQSIGV